MKGLAQLAGVFDVDDECPLLPIASRMPLTQGRTRQVDETGKMEGQEQGRGGHCKGAGRGASSLDKEDCGERFLVWAILPIETSEVARLHPEARWAEGARLCCRPRDGAWPVRHATGHGPCRKTRVTQGATSGTGGEEGKGGSMGHAA
jgi:hypothetical protein